jgi:hypothetical protein
MNELRRAAPFLAFALALLVAGCALLPGPLGKAGPTEPTGDPTQPQPAVAATIAAQQIALNLAAERWAAAGTDDYRLDLGFLCSCALPARVLVEVVDGVPTATDGDGKPLDADALALTPVTVDQLFAEGRRAHAGGGTVGATFDPTTGVPARLDIDYLPQAIDDELSIVVNGFEPAGS